MSDENAEKPEAPLMHIYRTDIYRCNRSYEIHHRVTTFGVMPRNFIEFMGKIVAPMPQKLPNGQIVQQLEPFFAPITGVTSVEEALTRFREIMEPQFKKYFDDKVESMSGGSRVIQARHIPKINPGG